MEEEKKPPEPPEFIDCKTGRHPHVRPLVFGWPATMHCPVCYAVAGYVDPEAKPRPIETGPE